jgi:hypothetical protein
MTTTYIPPKQSIPGQLFDVAFLLALVFAALFLPIWLGIAVPSRVEKLPPGVSYTLKPDKTTKVWKNLTWESLGQNPVMVQQWTKLKDANGNPYTKESAADIITMPFDYTIDVAGVAITGIVILGYFLFLLFMSAKEYKQVIAEKFD